MIPVNDSIDRGWMVAQINSMIKSKQALLGLDCKDKNMIGFAYDSGYMQCSRIDLYGLRGECTPRRFHRTEFFCQHFTVGYRRAAGRSYYL